MLEEVSLHNPASYPESYQSANSEPTLLASTFTDEQIAELESVVTVHLLYGQSFQNDPNACCERVNRLFEPLFSQRCCCAAACGRPRLTVGSVVKPIAIAFGLIALAGVVIAISRWLSPLQNVSDGI